MDRLTKVGEDGYVYRFNCEISDADAWNKLAHYEELEEKGLLVELPCKVGDTVYLLDFENSAYDEATVELVKIENEGIFIDTDYEIGTWEKAEYIRYSESEAEQALAERQKNEDIKTT